MLTAYLCPVSHGIQDLPQVHVGLGLLPDELLAEDELAWNSDENGVLTGGISRGHDATALSISQLFDHYAIEHDAVQMSPRAESANR